MGVRPLRAARVSVDVRPLRAARRRVEDRPPRVVPTLTHGRATHGPHGSQAGTTGKGAALGKEEAHRAEIGVRAAIPLGVEARAEGMIRGIRPRDSPFSRRRPLLKTLKYGLDLGDLSQKRGKRKLRRPMAPCRDRRFRSSLRRRRRHHGPHRPRVHLGDPLRKVLAEPRVRDRL